MRTDIHTDTHTHETTTVVKLKLKFIKSPTWDTKYSTYVEKNKIIQQKNSRISKKFPKLIHNLDVSLHQLCQKLVSRAEVEAKFLVVLTHEVVNDRHIQVLLIT